MNDAMDDDARIDAAIRRAFTPPPLDAMVAAALEGHQSGGRRRWPWLVAAALLIGAIAAIGSLTFGRDRVDTHVEADASKVVAEWVDAYHDAVARGFDAPGCCDPSSSLSRRCRELFSAAVDVTPGADVRVCGSYCGKPAGGAVAMLARSGDEPICVFVLPRARAPKLADGVVDGVSIHRRELGELVVFELSRAATPRLLPRMFVPEG